MESFLQQNMLQSIFMNSLKISSRTNHWALNWNALKKERSWRICKWKNLSNQPVWFGSLPEHTGWVVFFVPPFLPYLLWNLRTSFYLFGVGGFVLPLLFFSKKLKKNIHGSKRLLIYSFKVVVFSGIC